MTFYEAENIRDILKCYKTGVFPFHTWHATRKGMCPSCWLPFDRVLRLSLATKPSTVLSSTRYAAPGHCRHATHAENRQHSTVRTAKYAIAMQFAAMHVHADSQGAELIANSKSVA